MGPDLLACRRAFARRALLDVSASAGQKAGGRAEALSPRYGPDLPFLLTFLAASSILFSIAVSQIAMALALAALLLSRQPLRFPPLKAPFLCVVSTLMAAWLLSPDPVHGLPQIRKLYVFTILILIASTFRTMRQIRGLLMAWAAIGTTSALRGAVQYAARRHEAVFEHASNDYGFFLDDRVRGWAGHWMTFGGEQMIVIALLAAMLLFGTKCGDRIVAAAASLVIGASLILSLTRGVFLLGIPAALIYLLWCRKPASVLLLPAAAPLVFLAAPFQVRERVTSVVEPHGDVDSNSHRIVSIRTGLEMIKAHPVFGLGPEQVGVQFDRYVPSDVPRPLPHGWYGHLHNIYLQYAAERGIPGLLAMLWFVLKPLADFLRALRRGGVPSERKWLFHGIIAATLAILAEGLVEYNLGDSEVLTMFLAAIGLGYTALDTSETAVCA